MVKRQFLCYYASLQLESDRLMLLTVLSSPRLLQNFISKLHQRKSIYRRSCLVVVIDIE